MWAAPRPEWERRGVVHEGHPGSASRFLCRRRPRNRYRRTGTREAGPPVYVRHEIVHNRYVVESLKAKGARFVEELSEVPAGAITIFSAHGVSRAVEDDAADSRAPRSRCHLPARHQGPQRGQRYIDHGRTVILIGHAGHPEVEGTLGQIADPSTSSKTRQTTSTRSIFPTIRRSPTSRRPRSALTTRERRSWRSSGASATSSVPETRDICYATQNRQTAVRELASTSN